SPLRCVLEGPRSEVRHNFSRSSGGSPVCLVPMRLHVHNTAQRSVAARFEPLSKDMKKPWKADDSARDIPEGVAQALNNTGELGDAPAYAWIGQTSCVLPRVAGGETCSLPLTLAVFTPGTFHVSSLCLSWAYHESCAAADKAQGAASVADGQTTDEKTVEEEEAEVVLHLPPPDGEPAGKDYLLTVTEEETTA
ncbi:hypothetical protein CYMTET_53195, partial [Cymbomonas tetramitiformis]